MRPKRLPAAGENDRAILLLERDRLEELVEDGRTTRSSSDWFTSIFRERHRARRADRRSRRNRIAAAGHPPRAGRSVGTRESAPAPRGVRRRLGNDAGRGDWSRVGTSPSSSTRSANRVGPSSGCGTARCTSARRSAWTRLRTCSGFLHGREPGPRAEVLGLALAVSVDRSSRARARCPVGLHRPAGDRRTCRRIETIDEQTEQEVECRPPGRRPCCRVGPSAFSAGIDLASARAPICTLDDRVHEGPAGVEGEAVSVDQEVVLDRTERRWSRSRQGSASRQRIRNTSRKLASTRRPSRSSASRKSSPGLQWCTTQEVVQDQDGQRVLAIAAWKRAKPPAEIVGMPTLAWRSIPESRCPVVELRNRRRRGRRRRPMTVDHALRLGQRRHLFSKTTAPGG